MDKENNEKYRAYLQSEQWAKIARKRLEIDKYRCQMCGAAGTPKNPLEVHHLSYTALYHEETRIYQDLVTLCHCCHKLLHRAMERTTNEDGRKGWRDSPRIPQIHVFTLNGTNLETKETEE